MIHEKNGVKYILFKNLEESGLVRHCFSTKVGGVSEDEFSTLNLGFKRGDKKENVEANYKLLCDAVGFNYNNIVLGSQTHLTNVYKVEKKDKGNGITKENTLKDIDGLITNEKGLVLTTFYADCVPLYFLDTQSKVIGISHAGWQGTLNNMAKSSIESLVTHYNCDPKNILVGIGPSICKTCFEVGMDVANDFIKNGYLNCMEKTSNDKYSIDLWKINKNQLKAEGVLPENIEVSNMCTKEMSDFFYSHRISGTKRGTMAAFIELI